jgi:hypothetical protein
MGFYSIYFLLFNSTDGFITTKCWVIANAHTVVLAHELQLADTMQVGLLWISEILFIFQTAANRQSSFHQNKTFDI